VFFNGGVLATKFANTQMMLASTSLSMLRPNNLRYPLTVRRNSTQERNQMKKFDSGALLIASDILDDLERTRIANQNRLRAFQNEQGMTGTPQEAKIVEIVNGLAALETMAETVLKKEMKRHPLGKWVATANGIGEKQGARLLASLSGGDPYIRPEFELEDGTIEPERPRTVSELWAYCGLRVDQGVAQRRKKGQQSNWNDEAKKRAFLVAESTMKRLTKPCGRVTEEDEFATHVDGCTCSPYRVLYDTQRAKHETSTHTFDCPRCGPKGKPALKGSPLSAGHRHMRSLRYVMKRILRDYYNESKRLQTETK